MPPVASANIANHAFVLCRLLVVKITGSLLVLLIELLQTGWLSVQLESASAVKTAPSSEIIALENENRSLREALNNACEQLENASGPPPSN